jgi:hypothetical protein
MLIIVIEYPFLSERYRKGKKIIDDKIPINISLVSLKYALSVM